MFPRPIAIWASLLLASMAPALADNAPGDAIGGTGRIEPRGGVVLLSGAPGATIKSINVHVGDFVARARCWRHWMTTAPAPSRRLPSSPTTRPSW